MNELAARRFLVAARRNLAQNASEAVVRNTFEQHLPQIYPEQPWWVRHHAEGAEALTRFVRHGLLSHGFVDTLIGATPIEYEANLLRGGVEAHAKGQIQDYAAGELNKGVPAHNIIGVISDTLRWKAYTIEVESGVVATSLGRDHVRLVQLDAVDLSVERPDDGLELTCFLERHLGRIAARLLKGEMLASDLGLESEVGTALRNALDGVYAKASNERPGYADLIDRLWSELVDAIGEGGSRNLGRTEYLDEFYLITLAKLVCANVLDQAAPRRSAAELADILNGAFFQRRGLRNYVEYDLFGWLSENVAASGMLAIAEAIQEDLVAYDFKAPADEDLFGQLLARLGRRSTRLILGQELTPPWLARKLVKRVAEGLGDQPLRLIDSACGSGTILVEAIRWERSRSVPDETPQQMARRLAAAATGFDIDPLAALFAKTNWVIALRDQLPLLPDMAIPVFHADSLFAAVNDGGEGYVMTLGDERLVPPTALMEPSGRPVFDELLSSAYSLAMQQAKGSAEPDISGAELAAKRASQQATVLVEIDLDELTQFAAVLIREFALLERRGRNGLWAYVIRNTSRAAQSTGQFNALAINPPWLALSRIARNPYGEQLSRLAGELGVRPAGQSFLHTELAVVFLLEGVRRYLEPDGCFGAILPSTVAQGHHQNRFRSGGYSTAPRSVNLDIDEIWGVERGVFRNEAVVLFGAKQPRQVRVELPGRDVGETAEASKIFHVATARYPGKADRVAWSSGDHTHAGFGYEPAPFRQGADLMPRTIWFHDFRDFGPDRVEVQPITKGEADGYLIADAKRNQTFRMPSGLVLERAFTTRAALSHHLTPFHLAHPAQMLLPGRFEHGAWRGLKMDEIVLASSGAQQAFEAAATELSKTPETLFGIVDLMGKLRRQSWSPSAYLVVSGAGGANPCAAWTEPGVLVPGEVVFDQTLYWAEVNSRDEAAYLVGAVNSPSCAEIIAPFQPKGDQGKRHIHKLPFGVTPPYDPSDPAHTELAAATLRLHEAFGAALTDDAIALAARRPGKGTLAGRRKRLSKVLQSLDEWDRYVDAARGIYEAG